MVFRFSDSIFNIFQRHSTALYLFFMRESIHLRNSWIEFAFIHYRMKMKAVTKRVFQSFQHFIQKKWKTMNKTEWRILENVEKRLNC